MTTDLKGLEHYINFTNTVLLQQDKAISVTCIAPSSAPCDHICNPKEKLCAKCISSKVLLVPSPHKREHGLPRNPSIT